MLHSPWANAPPQPTTTHHLQPQDLQPPAAAIPSCLSHHQPHAAHGRPCQLQHQRDGSGSARLQAAHKVVLAHASLLHHLPAAGAPVARQPGNWQMLHLPSASAPSAIGSHQPRSPPPATPQAQLYQILDQHPVPICPPRMNMTHARPARPRALGILGSPHPRKTYQVTSTPGDMAARLMGPPHPQLMAMTPASTSGMVT